MTNLFRLFVFAAFVLVGPISVPYSAQVYAQETPGLPDYAAWARVADQAEIALTRKRASNVALEGLRENLVDWRGRFLAATGQNSARINSVENQISALGPKPADGESQAQGVVARRASLTAELETLIAPARVAQEAYRRADGLIRETDSIIRARNTARLLENIGSPLVPARWPAAFGALTEGFGQAYRETKVAYETNRDQFLSLRDLPTTVFFLVLALVLLVRARGWMVRLTGFVQGEMGDARAGFRGFLVSLGQLFLPIFGIISLNLGLSASGLLGFRGQIIADSLIPVGVAFFVARWLTLRLLPLVRKRRGFLQISDKNASQVRRNSVVLAVVWGLNELLTELGTFEGMSTATLGVLKFPLVVIAGFLLARIGQSLRSSIRQEVLDETEKGGVGAEEWNFRSRSVGLFGFALIAVGVVGPVAMAFGFVTAGTSAVFSSILTLGVFAFVIVMAGVLRDVYALVLRIDDVLARQSLVPVLVSFCLVILALPVLALIWGARYSDLTEMWTRFQEGVALGDVTISPGAFLTFAVVFVIGYMATRLLQSTLRTSVLPKTKIDTGGQSAIVSGIGYLGIFFAALIAISTAGIDLSSLAIVAGALSVGIGFGLQNIVSNFVSGIILLVERPVTEGDWISVGGHEGTVRNISVRSTTIETFDRSDVIIPNADLVSGAVTNYTRGNTVGRAVVSVGVAYGSDTRRVHEILGEAALVHPLVYDDPPPGVHLVAFGADSIDFQIRAVLRDVNYVLTVKSEILHEINRRFALEGIEIPFAQRDVWLRNPELLPGGAKPTGKVKSK